MVTQGKGPCGLVCWWHRGASLTLPFLCPGGGVPPPSGCGLRATGSLSPHLSPCPHPGAAWSLHPRTPLTFTGTRSRTLTYTHTHPGTHSLTHTHKPTYSQSLPHGHTHHITTLICSYTHSDSLPYTHTLTRTHTLSRAHVYSHSPTLTHCLAHTPCFREDQAAGHSRVPTLSSTSWPPSPEVCSHHMGTCQPLSASHLDVWHGPGGGSFWFSGCSGGAAISSQSLSFNPRPQTDAIIAEEAAHSTGSPFTTKGLGKVHERNPTS